MSETKITVIFNKLEKIEKMVSGIEIKLATVENNFTHLEKDVDKNTEKVDDLERNGAKASDLDRLELNQKNYITDKGVKFLLTILGFIITAIC